MTLEKKRWILLAAGCLMVLCVGSLYAWSVFANPMTEYLSGLAGGPVRNLSIIFTLANISGPITMILGGYFNDKAGPRYVLLAGGLLFAFGMIGSGFVKSVGLLMVTYGLGVGLGNGLVYGTTLSHIVKFFPDRRGFAGGMITAFDGLGSIVTPILATALLRQWPVSTVFKILGVGAGIILCSASLVMIPHPQTASKAASGAGPEQGEYTYREMLRQKSFYVMMAMLTCGAFAGMMVISQASPIAQKMMAFSPERAAVVVSFLALFNMLGRLISGTLSDRFGVLNVIRVLFVFTIAAGILLYFCTAGSAVQFYLAIALIGFSFGGIMGVYPSFTASRFGARNNSLNYGIMFIGFALAGLLGPMIMNGLAGALGRYQPAFLVCAVLAALGIVLNVLCARIKPE